MLKEDALLLPKQSDGILADIGDMLQPLPQTKRERARHDRKHLHHLGKQKTATFSANEDQRKSEEKKEEERRKDNK